MNRAPDGKPISNCLVIKINPLNLRLRDYSMFTTFSMIEMPNCHAGKIISFSEPDFLVLICTRFDPFIFVSCDHTNFKFDDSFTLVRKDAWRKL